jgi:hypothetical protein
LPNRLTAPYLSTPVRGLSKLYRRQHALDFLDGTSAQHLIGQYGYGAIFVIVMLESAGIPMPGETILVSAAVYAGTRHALDIHWVITAGQEEQS